MLGLQDIRHLHREIKASTPGLILTILLINTDVGWWVVEEQSFPAHSLPFSPPCLPVSVISLSCTLCFSSYTLFLSVSLHPPPPALFSISPSLCTFFILSCVSLDQTGEALHALPFYLFHICNCQKEDCYFRSCLCFVVLMESQIEEVVLKASWPLCGDTNNVSCGLGSPRQLKMALQVHETWCLLDGTVLRGAVKTVLARGGNWSQASATLPPAVCVT